MIKVVNSPINILLGYGSKGRTFRKELPESKIDVGGVYYLNGRHRYFYTKKGYEDTVKIIVDKSIKSRDWLYTFFKKAVEKMKSG